jgi:hypothetical protein
MPSEDANPATGDRGARQIVRRSGKNADLNSQHPLLPQAPGRADTFGARQAVIVAAFMSRRKVASAPIGARTLPHTIRGGE